MIDKIKSTTPKNLTHFFQPSVYFKPEPNKEPELEPKPEPTEWSTIYDNIRTMRAKADAPVDTMGCEECYAACATEKERRFQVYQAPVNL